MMEHFLRIVFWPFWGCCMVVVIASIAGELRQSEPAGETIVYKRTDRLPKGRCE